MQAQRAQDEKYNTPGQLAAVAGESVVRGAVGPAAGAVLHAFGDDDPEEILNREKAHPWIDAAGQTATLVAGSMLGVGEGAVLGKIGDAAVSAAGLAAPATRMAKIGSAAVRLGIENAVYQGGSDIDKMVMGDPATSVEGSVVNMGLAGLLGAGTGAAGAGVISPLWDATVGPRVGKFLQSFKNVAEGTPTALPESIDKAVQDSGIELSQPVRAAMTGNAYAADTFNVLREQQRPEILDGIKDLQQQASEKSMEALGKTPEEVSNYSEAEQGRKGIDDFKNEYELKRAPVQKAYDEVAKPFQEAEFEPRKVNQVQTEATKKNPYLNPQFETVSTPGDADIIAEKLDAFAKEHGYDQPGLPHNDIIQQAQKGLQSVRNIKELQNLASNVGGIAYGNPATRRLGGQLSDFFLNAEQDVMQRKIGAAGSAELLGKFKNARTGYANLMKMTREAADHLSLGKVKGPQDFLDKIAAKRTPEEFLRKLSPKGNAEIIPFLQEHFPATLERVRANELQQLIEPAVRRAKGDHPIDIKTLESGINNLSPEMKQFVFKGEAAGGQNEQSLREGIKYLSESIQTQKKLAAEALARKDSIGAHEHMGNVNALETSLANSTQMLEKGASSGVQSGALNKIRAAKLLADSLPDFKSSGTAGWQSKVNKHVLGGVAATASAIFGHNPAVGFILGEAGNALAKDAPNAIRLAMLKFMGSEKPINAGGFKAAVDMIQSTIKGAALTGKATKALFTPGQEVLDSKYLSSADDRDRLDKKLKALQENPSPLINSSNQISHYMPEHAAAMSATSANAVRYLNSLRPVNKPQGFLKGSPEEGSATIDKKAAYNNALDIAHQPLTLLNKIKQGSLTSADMQHGKALYPNLLGDLSQKITNELADASHRGETIPYHVLASTSLFLGHPLDSSLSQQSIAAAQPKPQMQQPQTPTQPASNPKRSTSSLNKLPSSYQTALQSAQSRHANDGKA
jgi:hypothetical protein